MTQPKSPHNAQAATLVAILAAVVLLLIAIGVSIKAALGGAGGAGASLPQMVMAAILVLLLLLLGWIGWATVRGAQDFHERNSELSRLALVANKTENAVLITGADGLIEWVNEGFTRITGQQAEEAIGKAPGAFLTGPLQNLQAIQKIRDAVTSQKPLTVEMLCAHRRGHRYWLALNLTPVFDGENHLTNFVGVASDITGRKRAEEELGRQSRRNELFLNGANREDDIRHFSPTVGLVDVKVMSFSDELSGLKLVIPLALRRDQ